MATYLEALKSINAYPIPMRTLEEIAYRRNVIPSIEIEPIELTGKNFRLAKADVLVWLSHAPNISQGGQSYSFNEDQRKAMREEASIIYQELEPSRRPIVPSFGYKGDRL